jgi:hypothetical protein
MKDDQCALQLFTYSGMMLLGLFTMKDEPWLWDTRKFWDGWPDQPLT